MAINDDLREIWLRSKPDVENRLRRCEEAVRAALDDELDDALRTEAKTAAHKLAGLVGMFGFKEAGDAARQAETILEGELNQEAVARLAKVVLEIRRGLHETGEATETVTETATSTGHVSSIILVDDDPIFRDAFCAAMASNGIKTSTAADLATGRQLRVSHPNELLFLDLGMPEGKPVVLNFMGEEQERHPVPPLVILSASPTMQDRIEAAKRGARAFLPKGLSIDDLTSEVQRLLQAHQSAQGKIVVLDDDPAIRQSVEKILTSAGLQVATAGEPELFWNLVQQMQPELVILDQNMPTANGTDVAVALRNEIGFKQPFILFLTGDELSSIDSRLKDINDSGYFQKPIDPTAFSRTVLDRLSQRRKADGEGHGLFMPLSEYETNSTRSMELAKKYGEPMSVGVVRMPGLAKIKDTVKRERAMTFFSRHVKNQFSADVKLGAYGSDGVLISSLGLDADEMRKAVRAICENLQKDDQKFGEETWAKAKIGYRTLESGDTWPELRDGAIESVHPLATDKRPKRKATMCDIAIVEDDEVIRDVLRQAIAGRNWSIEEIEDGAKANDILLGEKPKIVPRLILLDINLPGIDGLTILRRLRDNNKTRGIPTIVISRRSTEEEIVQALDAGAVDHVAKPVSIPVLLTKIQRWLEG